MSGRLPLDLYKWLEDRVGDGREYPSMTQALIGELRRAKKVNTLSPCAPGASLKEQLEDHDCLRGVTCKEEA